MFLNEWYFHIDLLNLQQWCKTWIKRHDTLSGPELIINSELKENIYSECYELTKLGWTFWQIETHLQFNLCNMQLIITKPWKVNQLVVSTVSSDCFLLCFWPSFISKFSPDPGTQWRALASVSPCFLVCWQLRLSPWRPERRWKRSCLSPSCEVCYRQEKIPQF